MIKKYINIALLIISSICFSILLGTYTKNRNLLYFNNIVLKGNNYISSEVIFNEINYELDSINFYTQKQMDQFEIKIKEFLKYDIIENIDISYSLPNIMLVNIYENKPTYILNNKVQSFALDSKGRILDTKFLFNSIKKVNLNVDTYKIYNPIIDNKILLKDLFQNIQNNRINNQQLIDALKILDWFHKMNFYKEINALSVNMHDIYINFKNTKIIFDRYNLFKQFSKLDKIINNRILLDSLKIKKISDLKEINLCFNNQIIIKK